MTTLTYNEIINQLRSDVVEVTFTKVNGEQRVMPCTLLSEFIPEADRPKTATVDDSVEAKPVNENTVSAFAIDKQAWRSFRVANVTSIQVING